MLSNPDVTTPLPCLFSTVRNISGAEMSFGFLGVHGRRLAAGAQYTVPGNIADQLAPYRRKFDALQRSLAGFVKDGVTIAPTLVLISTPAVHVYDAVTDVTKVINLSSGALGTVDPCWGTYTSV